MDKSDHITNRSPLPDGTQNGLRSYFSTFWNLPFSTVLSFFPLVVQNHHTSFSDFGGKGHNTRGGECASNLDHNTRKTSPIHQHTEQTWHKLQPSVAYGWKENWVPYVFCYKEATRMKLKCPECNMGLYATPSFKVYHTKQHLWGPSDTKHSCVVTSVKDRPTASHAGCTRWPKWIPGALGYSWATLPWGL